MAGFDTLKEIAVAARQLAQSTREGVKLVLYIGPNTHGIAVQYSGGYERPFVSLESCRDFFVGMLEGGDGPRKAAALEKAEELQRQIDEMERKRQQILDKYGP